MTWLFRKSLAPLFCGLCLFLLAIANLSSAQAARGVPGSTEFGIGATLNLDGPMAAEALDVAEALDLDWVRVPLDWSVVQPRASQPADLASLDSLMQAAGQRQAAVLVSLENAPEWARTPAGPDPALTAQMAVALAQRYPSALNALELFPGANTQAAWGAAPDAGAYARLFLEVREHLRANGAAVTLVAAGLRGGPVQAGDLEDTLFLADLYAQGASQWMPVLSLTYMDTTGAPLDFPSTPSEPVLRHYEVIRQVMEANQHQTGLIWITQFSSPLGTIDPADRVYQERNAQSNWMSLATIQLRAQLYVGAIFVQDINPRAGGKGVGIPSLIEANGETHPFYSVLREMISLKKTGSVSILPGQPKEGSLPKKRP